MDSKLLPTVGVLIALSMGSFVHLGSAQTRGETEQPPVIGRMIDLGGYRLHLDCSGKGEPTVVLSAGAGGFSTDWALVQSKVANFTRVCSYDSWRRPAGPILSL